MGEAAVHLYQIAYSSATLAAVEPGYLVLDNLANPRPDWYEYWPIRLFLLNETLDEAAWYGFFSPKFGAKTGLSHADVVRTVQAAAPSADVVLFSPQPDMGAFFLNVFEQGETFDAGFIAAFEAFLRHAGQPAELRAIVMDARQTVFSNYFVARPAFWRAWLAIGEALFAVCEASDIEEHVELRRALTATTSYAGAMRKVFIQERIASFLLATQPQWRSVAANPFAFAWSATRFREHPVEAVISDALKTAYRDRPYPQYLHAFGRVRAIFSGKPMF
ncbi:MAG: hypothetical protein WA210_05900 [Burkholderiaceae bacterium]